MMRIMGAVTRHILAAAACLVLAANSGWPADAVSRTRTLIRVLQSEASLFEKARACQQLGEIGTAEAVPVLAGLLNDPKLSAFARSGLEGIPDPSAAAALREAAGKIQGPLLAGVINSLGTLRDPKAVEVLAKLASSPASGVVGEALLALGNISTRESTQVLREALATAPEATRGEAAAACLLAADRQRSAGDLSQAATLYDLLRQPGIPTAIRIGATRGAILARQADRVTFLIEQLKSDELPIRDGALLTVREIPDNALADALNTEIARAKPELQGQLLLAIADCHNSQSIPAVQGLSSSADLEIRKTALAVLGRLGAGAAPALIAALRQDRPTEERSAVLNGLRGIEGPATDDLLIQALATADTSRQKIDLIRVLENRGATPAVPALQKLGGDNEKDVRIAALSALSSLASAKEAPALIAFIKACSDDETRDAAENALAAVCGRSGEEASAAVLNELTQSTKPSERNSWVRVLARTGYSKALPAIQAATADPDPAVAENALAQLAHWPNPAPMETLLKAMDSGTNPDLRKRALASVLELASTVADDAAAPDYTIAGWVARANAVVQSTPDKRKVLGLLGRLKTPESLQLLAPYLEDPTLRTDAAAAVVGLAPALAKGIAGPELKMALEKVATSAANPDLRDRALRLAKTIPAAAAVVSLFDGRSLAGWEGDTNVWRVRDGVIVGGSMAGNARNEFLATLRSYTNCILRLEYKLVGTEGFINGGVQFRSVRMKNPPNEMSGYQGDIGAGYSGCLYDESRRNKFLLRPDDATIKRLERAGDWNRYEIQCEGKRAQLRLNGEKTVDYTEPDAGIPESGLIGLQIHGGCKAEISFRNLTIQELR